MKNYGSVLFVLALMVSLVSSTCMPHIAQAYDVPSLIKDINVDGQGTDIEVDEQHPVLFNGEFYFAARGESYSEIGSELWKTDGTEEGTVLVKDIYEGVYNSSPRGFMEAGGVLYFSATTADGEELWKTDGTEEGTAQVKDVREGPNSANPGFLTAFGSDLYFVAQTEEGAMVLKSDGTSGGTDIFMDPEVLIGTDNYNVYVAGATSDSVFFYIYNYNDANSYLVKSDGTVFGTEFVEDVNGEDLTKVRVETDDGQVTNVKAIGDTLYFSYCTDDEGCELARFDPGVGHAEIVKDFSADSGDSYFRRFTLTGNSTLWLMVCPAEGDCEPWSTDGTEGGTYRLADVNEGSGNSDPDIVGLSSDRNLLFFSAYDGNETTLWYTDVMASSTTLVAHVGDDGKYIDSNGAVLDGSLYLSLCSDDEEDGDCELYKTTDSLDGMELVKDIYDSGSQGSEPDSLVLMGDRIVFSAEDAEHGDELWVTDGTEGGTQLLADLTSGTVGSDDEDLEAVVFGNTILMSSYTSEYGHELWVTDGTEDGTELVKDINPGRNWSDIESITSLGSTAVFKARTEDEGSELWVTDGTEGGTHMVKDINEGSDGSDPDAFAAVGTKAYFRANDGDTGAELWVTDGTEGGTHMVKDILVGSDGSYPEQLIALDGAVLFSAADGTVGGELWKTDGTEEGTVLVKDINEGSDGSGSTNFTPLGNELVFKAYSNADGYLLMKTDGTPEGTVRIADPSPTELYADYTELTRVGNKVYFKTYHPDYGEELWATDGTEGGTYMVKDIYPESGSSYPQRLTAAGSTLFFQASAPDYGAELWVTDGTEGGTHMVKDIREGEYGSNISSMVSIGSLVFFAPFTEEYGTELWTSDGTEEGTYMVHDLAVGLEDGEGGLRQIGSNPYYLIPFRDGLFFYAWTPEYSHEPYFLGDVPQPEPEPEEEESVPQEPGSSGNGRSSGGSRRATTLGSAQQPVATAQATVASFSRNLDVGTTGSDVRELQKFLNGRGFAVALTGPGSAGNETDLFGNATKAALARFQTANGIVPAAGYFGPVTRALVSSQGTVAPSAPVSSSAETPVAVPSVRDLTMGMTGSDVNALQQLLLAQGYLIPAGPTGFFAGQTRDALAAYQAKGGIVPAIGYFGEQTRAQMKSAGLSGLWW